MDALGVTAQAWFTRQDPRGRAVLAGTVPGSPPVPQDRWQPCRGDPAWLESFSPSIPLSTLQSRTAGHGRESHLTTPKVLPIPCRVGEAGGG